MSDSKPVKSSKALTWVFDAHMPNIILPPLSPEAQKYLNFDKAVTNNQPEVVQQVIHIHNLFLKRRALLANRLVAMQSFQIHYLKVALNILQLINNVQSSATHPSLNNKLPGPKLNRNDLEYISHGEIYRIMGNTFKQQAKYAKQVRMPEPPLLLCDRVLGIDGEAGSMKTGTIWTQTDVTENAWYLHRGRMPAGITIESGQADLLLISWLGIDFLNKGNRVYRLLGSEVTFYKTLPKPGDTLHYEIRIEGHAKHGDVRLFFFNYDCTINNETVLSVRHGQAGFFTEQELADSQGVLWSCEEAEYDSNAQLDPPVIKCIYSKFTRQEIENFANGKGFDCFGPGFENLAAHTLSPAIQSGDMLFLDEITEFDPQGGPWKRGYISATQHIKPDDWFFKGHFFNDPCMPGTLMLEAGLQLMSFYMGAIGLTVDKDSWRFEPTKDITYKLQCRGQVLPSSKLVTYEIFIESVIMKPIPIVLGHLLGTVDGLKSFYTKIGVSLVPDWPIKISKTDASKSKETPSYDNFHFDSNSLKACSLSRAEDAFGPIYKNVENYKRMVKLPAAPYHCVSKILHISHPPNTYTSDVKVHTEFHINRDSWYIRNNNAVVPYCIFMEAALQPCGWLACYIGCPLRSENELLFRNLDGTATIYQDIPNRDGKLVHKIHNYSLSKAGDMILVGFKVQAFYQDTLAYELDTKFGFFPPSAFDNQVGLPATEKQKQDVAIASDFRIELKTPTTVTTDYLYLLPKEKILMIDAITGYWPNDGEFNQGLVRAEKIIDPNEWFFKAHFFQDPVQPGSLGVEAMLQVLKWYLLHQGAHKKFQHPVFEMAMLNREHVWKYRGQVVPGNKKVKIIADIKNYAEDEIGIFVEAKLHYWVDGIKIYEGNPLAMRIKEGS